MTTATTTSVQSVLDPTRIKLRSLVVTRVQNSKCCAESTTTTTMTTTTLPRLGILNVTIHHRVLCWGICPLLVMERINGAEDGEGEEKNNKSAHRG